MLQAAQEQVVEALQSAGVRPGDGLLVHSAIQYLGQPMGGVAMYYRALCAVLDGDQSPSSYPVPPESQPVSGTIAVPAFNFAFARGEPFDPDETPSVGMGAFSEYVRQLPHAHRSSHPLQSLAAVGRYAADLAGRDTSGAFDPGSPFERMLKLNFKLLLLGADIQAVAMLHYCEQRLGVPYRYWKDFTAEVKTASGWQSLTYRMYARDLSINPKIELYPVQDVLQERGQWSSVKLNYGSIALCSLADFVTAVDEFLARDPWSLVTNPPTEYRKMK